jgi:cytoskeleton protein RodZ
VIGALFNVGADGLAMSDFGGQLRGARERRGVSLGQVSAATKISISALEALERNDISKLPGGIFTRGFIRSYANEVGLNPDDTLREFFHQFQAPTAAAPPPTATGRTSTSDVYNRRRTGVVIPIIIVGVAIGAWLRYGTLRQPSADVSAPTATATASDTPRRDAVAPSTGATVGTAGRVPATAANAFDLRFETTAPCWVGLTVDGRRIVARIMKPGETETVRISGAAVLRVGDTGAFRYTINGRAGQPLGSRGGVRTVHLNRETIAQYAR